jgi:hypothetical protein
MCNMPASDLASQKTVSSAAAQVYVTVANANGTSMASQPVVFIPATAPGPPTSTTVSATGQVTFTPPAYTGASSITGYTAIAVPQSGGPNVTVDGSASPLQLGGLQNGESYTVRLPQLAEIIYFDSNMAWWKSRMPSPQC